MRISPFVIPPLPFFCFPHLLGCPVMYKRGCRDFAFFFLLFNTCQVDTYIAYTANVKCDSWRDDNKKIMTSFVLSDTQFLPWRRYHRAILYYHNVSVFFLFFSPLFFIYFFIFYFYPIARLLARGAFVCVNRSERVKESRVCVCVCAVCVSVRTRARRIPHPLIFSFCILC